MIFARQFGACLSTKAAAAAAAETALNVATIYATVSITARKGSNSTLKLNEINGLIREKGSNENNNNYFAFHAEMIERKFATTDRHSYSRVRDFLV